MSGGLFYLFIVSYVTSKLIIDKAKNWKERHLHCIGKSIHMKKTQPVALLLNNSHVLQKKVPQMTNIVQVVSFSNKLFDKRLSLVETNRECPKYLRCPVLALCAWLACKIGPAKFQWCETFFFATWRTMRPLLLKLYFCG